MVVCKRCHGYVNMTIETGLGSDPSCVNCGCSYPELNTFRNNTKKRKGLREAIRYTGKSHDRKGILGYITYAQHPNKGSLYPMLIVECPTCTKKTKVITTSTNPYALDTGVPPESVNGYKVANQFIKCPTGHLFRLKVNEQGIFSWE